MKFESTNATWLATSFIFAAILIFFDQLSKYLIRSSGGFYICNQGIAFGILVPFVLLWSLILILLVLIIRNWKFVISNLGIENNPNYKLPFTNYRSPLVTYGLIMIISGGLSNFADRLNFGCVIDFIDLNFWPASNAMRSIAGWPIFNLADVFIVIGALFILFKSIKK
jgi:lipoprotein signal peptidase